MDFTKSRAIVVLNAQHSLFDEQKQLLSENFDSIEFLTVPADGWTLAEQEKEIEKLSEMMDVSDMYPVIVFASPVPVMLSAMATIAAVKNGDVQVFHNDRRNKKELPNGRVIMTVAPTGWQLV